MIKQYDVVALGELLIDFTDNGLSAQGNPVLEANPGGAVCNVLSMLSRFQRKTAYIGKVGRDGFGTLLESALKEQRIKAGNHAYLGCDVFLLGDLSVPAAVPDVPVKNR